MTPQVTFTVDGQIFFGEKLNPINLIYQYNIIVDLIDGTGTLIATGSADRTVRVWDVERGYCTHNFREHTDIVQSVYFHPDPNRLLLFSCSEDNTIRIFDLRDNISVACFR